MNREFPLTAVRILAGKTLNSKVNAKNMYKLPNRPFPSSSLPHLQSESKCEVFVMKISFHSYVK